MINDFLFNTVCLWISKNNQAYKCTNLVSEIIVELSGYGDPLVICYDVVL